jgi:hypothetical protein
MTPLQDMSLSVHASPRLHSTEVVIQNGIRVKQCPELDPTSTTVDIPMLAIMSALIAAK